MIIETKDKDGKPNGWVQTIWSNRMGAVCGSFTPEQVYLTVVIPGCSKGPHLHKKRNGMFACVRGAAELILRAEGDNCYMKFRLNRHCLPVVVLPGTACEIRCVGDEPAYLINMPSPAWSADDPDEWPVEDWNPDGA